MQSIYMNMNRDTVTYQAYVCIKRYKVASAVYSIHHIKKNKTQGRKTINSRSTSIVNHTEKNATFWEKIDEKLLILQKVEK